MPRQYYYQYHGIDFYAHDETSDNFGYVEIFNNRFTTPITLSQFGIVNSITHDMTLPINTACRVRVSDLSDGVRSLLGFLPLRPPVPPAHTRYATSSPTYQNIPREQPESGIRNRQELHNYYRMAMASMLSDEPNSKEADTDKAPSRKSGFKKFVQGHKL